MNMDLPLRLILFDGVCNLCNGTVQFIISHDPDAQFSFTSLQSATGQQVLESLISPRLTLILSFISEMA